jgi:hypothetical protein
MRVEHDEMKLLDAVAWLLQSGRPTSIMHCWCLTKTASYIWLLGFLAAC